MSQTPGAENRPPPRTGYKNILKRRIRNRYVKIKKLLHCADFKKVQVKENGRLVRVMNVRRKTVYSPRSIPVEY